MEGHKGLIPFQCHVAPAVAIVKDNPKIMEVVKINVVKGF